MAVWQIVKIPVKRTYRITEQLDMALKLRAVKDRCYDSDIVVAALERYLGIKSERKVRKGVKS